MNSTLSLEIFSGSQCKKALSDFFTADHLTMQSEAILLRHMRELVNILRPIGKKLNIHFSVEVLDAAYALFLVNKQRHKYMPGENDFTGREMEVYSLIVQGFTSMRIAKALYISLETVRTHRKHIRAKTGANSTASLISFYYRHIAAREMGLQPI